jgi:formamidopyrimidine-DNA glycosylase
VSSEDHTVTYAVVRTNSGFQVARIVHFLRAHLVGKTVKSATAIEDANVFGKVGTTGPEVAKALKGRKVRH